MSTDMDEKERNRIPAYVHAMLGNNRTSCFRKCRFFLSPNYWPRLPREGRTVCGKVFNHPSKLEAVTKIEELDLALSDKEYDLLMMMINIFKKWYPDVSFPLSILCPFLSMLNQLLSA